MFALTISTTLYSSVCGHVLWALNDSVRIGGIALFAILCQLPVLAPDASQRRYVVGKSGLSMTALYLLLTVANRFIGGISLINFLVLLAAAPWRLFDYTSLLHRLFDYIMAKLPIQGLAAQQQFTPSWSTWFERVFWTAFIIYWLSPWSGAILLSWSSALLLVIIVVFLTDRKLRTSDNRFSTKVVGTMFVAVNLTFTLVWYANIWPVMAELSCSIKPGWTDVFG